MNRINPLYLGLSLIVLITFISYRLNSLSNEYILAKNEYKERLALANELSSLKNVYADKKMVRKSLEKILNNSTLKKYKFNKTFTKSSLKIEAKSLDIKGLNFLMGKLLNGTYQIKALKIKKLSDLRVSLELEIKW